MQEHGLNREQLRATGRLVEQASMGHQRPISSRLGPLVEATEVSLRAIQVSNAERFNRCIMHEPSFRPLFLNPAIPRCIVCGSSLTQKFGWRSFRTIPWLPIPLRLMRLPRYHVAVQSEQDSLTEGIAASFRFVTVGTSLQAVRHIIIQVKQHVGEVQLVLLL